MLRKIARYMYLYVFAWIRSTIAGEPRLMVSEVVAGAKAIIMLRTSISEPKHSVVVFVLNAQLDMQKYQYAIVGPFGHEDNITTKNGKHIYGLDTWGAANQWMIDNNSELRNLLAKFGENKILQFAGVRSLGGIHIPPLNDPSIFFLVKR